MACYSPMTGYRLDSGGVSIGYEKAGSIENLRIPCGRCFGCRMSYAAVWATRLQHETMCWSRSAFVTLTYDDDHVGWRGLQLDDLQKFLKRLRKAKNGAEESNDRRTPIRYFAAGEYGEQTQRPHFHAALFNVELDARGGHSDLLQRIWPFGFHTISEFTAGRARYIAGYATKKVYGRAASRDAYQVVNYETGEVAQARREFAVMSRRPGIGAYFLEKYRADLNRGYVQARGGQRERMPRYYHNKLMEDPEYAYDDECRKEEYRLQREPGADTEERRLASSEIHKARFSMGKPRGF